VRTALVFLQHHLGGWVHLARAMGLKKKTLEQAVKRKGRRPTAGFAIRAAHVARVRVESVLSGAWPSPRTKGLRKRLF
jgi:hypothetical protein